LFQSKNGVIYMAPVPVQFLYAKRDLSM